MDSQLPRAGESRTLLVSSRLASVGIVAVALVVGALAVSRDRARRRSEREHRSDVSAIAARVAGAEIALHSASRWLRHPTRSEPWAASADGPAMLDVDPAGALAPPPMEVLRAGWPATPVTVRGPR